MSLFRAGFYIFAGFIPFRSVQAGVWGWYLGTPRAGKTFTSSGFWNQDKGPQELPWKSLLAVSPFLPTCSPMSCLLPVSSSHSQPINLVMPCVCLKSHTGRAASSASLPCQWQHPILPAAARAGSFPCKQRNLLLVTTQCSLPPSKHASTYIHTLLGCLWSCLSASIVWLLRKHLQSIFCILETSIEQEAGYLGIFWTKYRKFSKNCLLGEGRRHFSLNNFWIKRFSKQVLCIFSRFRYGTMTGQAFRNPSWVS